jgi:hypothetical protein
MPQARRFQGPPPLPYSLIRMPRRYRLNYFTKGTGASVEPFDESGRAASQEDPKTLRRGAGRRAAKRRSTSAPGGGRPRSASATSGDRGSRRSTPLPPGHVRKKATGEIGRVQAIDAKAGTATVLWLRQGRTSTVPLATVSRR